MKTNLQESLARINQVNGHGTHPSVITDVDSTDFDARPRGLYVNETERQIHFAESDTKTIRMMQRSIERECGIELQTGEQLENGCITFILPPVFEELDDAPVDA